MNDLYFGEHWSFLCELSLVSLQLRLFLLAVLLCHADRCGVA